MELEEQQQIPTKGLSFEDTPTQLSLDSSTPRILPARDYSGAGGGSPEAMSEVFSGYTDPRPHGACHGGLEADRGLNGSVTAGVGGHCDVGGGLRVEGIAGVGLQDSARSGETKPEGSFGVGVTKKVGGFRLGPNVDVGVGREGETTVTGGLTIRR